MAKLLEIFSLGIQNAKNVMFWPILRKSINKGINGLFRLFLGNSLCFGLNLVGLVM
jgi:hypothetical protein